jgi:hypothetical protein
MLKNGFTNSPFILCIGFHGFAFLATFVAKLFSLHFHYALSQVHCILSRYLPLTKLGLMY